MSKKIRVKIKHLIYIFLGMFITVFFMLPNALFIYAQAMEKNNVEVSKVFYKRYISLFPYGSKKAEALYNLAQKIVPSDSFYNRYKIYATGSGGGGGVITREMIDNAAVYYREILNEHKDSEYYIRAYSSLINLYNMDGKFDESEKLIEEGIKSHRDDLKLTAIKYKMLSLIIGGKYDEGRSIGKNLIEEGKADPDIYMLMGDINFYDRNLDDALVFYEEARDMTGWTEGGNPRKFTMDYCENVFIDEKIRIVNKIKNGYMGNSSIHGKVVINGKPVPFAYVYLKDEKEGGLNAIGDEGQKINAITNFKGEYVIPLLPEGDYILGVGLPSAYLYDTLYQTPKEGFFHLSKGEKKEYNFTFVPPMKLIKPSGALVPKEGKIEVEWEEVEGAAYYTVKLVVFQDPSKEDGGGSYAGVYVGGKITGTRFTMDINRINMQTLGFMMDDEGMINPQAYLGVFYPGSRIPFSVEAFDREGRLIKSTVPMKMNFKDMAVIYTPQEGLTEGDRLVLERELEEAVKVYERDLEKNPEDIHAMRILSKIYSIGTRRKFVPGKGDEIEGRDKDRAIELARKLYELTGDFYYLKASLNTHFIEDVEDYNWALEEYAKIPESELEGDDYARIAFMNLSIKNYKEADRYFEKVYDIYKDTNYYDLAPVILRLYFKEYDNSLKFLNILNLRLYKVDKEKLREDIKKLRNIDKESIDYKKFEEALEVILNYRENRGYRKQFIEIFESIKDPIFLDLLKSIGNYYNVFDRYYEE